MNMIHAVSWDPHIILLYNVPRHADNGTVRRNLLDHNRSSSDFGVFPDRKRSDNLCTGADHNIILQRRVTFSGLLTITAERHALIQRHVVSDDGRLSDDNACSMVDKQSLSDRRTRMDFDTGFSRCPL